jgi:hypothetical protein
MQDKLKEFFENLSQSISEQQWAQELKAKWEELDAQSKLYLKLSLMGLGVFAVIFSLLSAVWSVHSLKQELTDKRILLTEIQDSSTELRKLKDSMPLLPPKAGGRGDSGSWTSYFESLASTSGMDKSNFVISPEKSGNISDQSKEALYDIDLKHVNVKQVINFAVSLENGQRTAKIRNLAVNTKADPMGYMDATLAVSGFTVIENK